MTDDLVRTLAFLFLRRGADVMERSKLLHMLTFDLRWLAPDQGKRALARALGAGLLREEGELVRAAFDPKLVEIPVNFRPRDGLADETGPITGKVPWRGADEAEAERARRGGLVSREVAALIVARRKGEDVVERAAALLKAPR